MVASETMRQRAGLAQRAIAPFEGSALDGGPQICWSFAILRDLVSLGSLLQVLGWIAFYTVALILIDSSMKADREPGKSFQINFEYKVF
jgi:hypothetical protein